MKKLFRVRFAPFRIPVERRLQTLGVLWFISVYFFWAPFFVFICLILLFTPFFWVPLGYFIWHAYDVFVVKTSSRGGRRSEWLRRSKHMEYMRDYFPISLHKSADLDPEKNYIFGCHPHGLFGCSHFCNFASEATGFSEKFPGIIPHLLTMKINFKMPIIRGYLLWMGICDVSKESIAWILTKQGKGQAAVIVIGGAEEALEAHAGVYKVTLKNRKGFIKLAIKTGASLVPVFSFGENELFVLAKNPQGSVLRRAQNYIKQLLGASPPVYHGRGIFNYTFGFMPYRKPIATFVGRPIDTPRNSSPSSELVDEIHKKYMDELKNIFEENKAKFGIDVDRKLEFI